jgi:ATP-dependent RNA helicase DDX3X
MLPGNCPKYPLPNGPMKNIDTTMVVAFEVDRSSPPEIRINHTTSDHMSNAYVPPHRRVSGDAPPARPPLAFEAPAGMPARPPAAITRTRSVPARMNEFTDEHVRRLFEANQDAGDMSVYEGSDVRVHSDYEPLAPIDAFPGCGVRNDILVSVAKLGFRGPTNVQKYAIPYVLAGHDLIVTSQTGSGKTAAYMLPVLSHLIGQARARDPSVVVLVPTRELALQIQTETTKFTECSDLKSVCVFGGSPMGDQLRQLRSARDILIATPGRLIDILQHGQLRLQNVRYLVLDEAYRMLDMGFEPQIDEVINHFDMPYPDNRQTLLFSATFPAEVRGLANRFMRRDVTRIEVGLQDPPRLIEQRFLYCTDSSKFSSLLEVISEVEGQTLVFAERKVTVDRIENYLYDSGCSVVAIHGDREMENRLAALRGFTNGRAQIMVATDVAARGIDIPNVAHVINVDLPSDLDSYIHRVGRTGRAGKKGIATSFWNEGNTPVLGQLVRHFRTNGQALPDGLEEFVESGGGRGMGGGGGGRGRGFGGRGRGWAGGRGRGPMIRDRSWGTMPR